MNKKSSEIIKQFKLLPHPERAWFKEILISESHLTRENGEKRPNVIGIQYMLCKNKISTSHGVKFAIEIWIYLENTPLNLWCLDDGNKE